MLSLCMIVKDEIDFIQGCLEKVSPFVDEMVIVDTGSTDGTLEFLKSYDCKLYEFQWCNDFSKARNFSVSKATNDWIIFIDADEYITEFNIEEIKNFTKSTYKEYLGNIAIKSYSKNYVNFEVQHLARVFNKKQYAFIRDIHEGPAPKYNFIPKVINLPIAVDHFGYLDEVREKKNKNYNYIEYLERSINNKYDPYLVKHLAGSHLNNKDFEKCIEIIDTIINNKSLENEYYFSDAVTIKLKACIGSKNYKRALPLQDYFEICKDDDNYVFFMAVIFAREKFGETALDLLEYLVNKPKLNMNRLVVINEIGDLLFSYEMYEDALVWYRKLKGVGDSGDKIKACEEKVSSTGENMASPSM